MATSSSTACSIARPAPGVPTNAERDAHGGEVESALIERYFRHLGAVRTDVVLGIGDDAALLRVPPGHELVMTTDSLVEGVHFPPGAAPRSLGHRALAVNLSDLAAMGATPCWALLSLTLPAIDDAWLGEFSEGFGLLARSAMWRWSAAT